MQPEFWLKTGTTIVLGQSHLVPLVSLYLGQIVTDTNLAGVLKIPFGYHN